MRRGIPTQPVAERDEQAMQDGVLASQETAGAGRFLTGEDPGPGRNRRSYGSTTSGAWGDRHLWIVPDALHLPGGSPGADERAVAVDSDIDRRFHRCPVAPKRRQQNGPLLGKRRERRGGCR